MSLELVAVFVFVAVVATGAWLIRRRLAAVDAAETGEPICLGCGFAAGGLSAGSFVCPGCRRDVRAVGLGPRRSGPFAGPFWRLVFFSAVLCAVALLVTALAMLALPRVQYVHEYATQWRSEQEFRLLQFSAVGWRRAGTPEPRRLDGEVHADLFLRSGELFTLEIQSPELRYRVIDSSGREKLPWSAPGVFDESAVTQWMGAAGVNPDAEEVRASALAAYARLARMLGLPERVPPPRWPGGSGGGSSGVSSHGGPPPYAVPAALAGWSVVWLVGVWLVLRPPLHKFPAAPPAGEVRP